MKHNTKGFTLIELIVTMALVIVVIMITGSAFESILKNSGRLVSSEESNIEGVIGLEMFRHDLQQMGYGLPNAFPVTPPQYAEASGEPARFLNDGKGDSTPGEIPRAVASLESVTGYTTVMAGTDYLAIKGATVGRNKASQKWTFLTYTSNGTKKPHQWPNAADNFASTNSVIVLDRTFASSGQVSNTLVYNTSTPKIYWATNPTDTMSDPAFNPLQPNQVYYMYGVDDGELRMPFNRADYFVARPADETQIPSTCAEGTGILYKANVKHGDGKLTYYPLLDCVADMQVVFGWDLNSNGVIDESGAYDDDAAKIPLSAASGVTQATIQQAMKSPETIRSSLKYIKVYIMAQEGRRDTNYTNTNNLVGNTLSVVVGDPDNVSLTKGYTAAQLTAKKWQNYRWKIYRIVVRPKNLSSN